MIGLLAKLAKAAKFAHTAGAAVDVASNKLGSSDVPAGSAANSTEETEEPVDDTPLDYETLLEAGVPDARELLSAGDAAKMIGKRIRKVALTATDDFLMCDYLCRDRANTALGVHLSANTPWHYFDTEITKKETFEGIGDVAFRGDRQIYVKVGETTFWINTAGEVTINMALEAARLVVDRLSGG